MNIYQLSTIKTTTALISCLTDIRIENVVQPVVPVIQRATSHKRGSRKDMQVDVYNLQTKRI